MNIKKLNRHSIYAMARVGYTSDNIEIRIYTDDPGKIPHFHFIGDGLDGCIRIGKAKYFPHGHHKSKLNTKQIRKLVKFLKSNHRNSNVSNWRYLLDLWNTNNSDVELSDDYPMPDYLYLE